MDAGLIAGGDMTPEAALSKLSYVLAKKELTLDAKKKVALHSLYSFSFISFFFTEETKTLTFLCPCPDDGAELAG